VAKRGESVILRLAPRAGRRARAAAPHASGLVDLAHHNRCACPYKLAPPPDSSKQSIVSTLHARNQLPPAVPAPPPPNPISTTTTTNSFKMTGGKSGGKASGSKSNAQS
jgi:hypothetical protein